MVRGKESGRSDAPRLIPPDLSAPWRYLVAVGTVVLAGVMEYLIFPYPSAAPFLLFYLAVVASAWVGGRGPGLIAAVLSAWAGNFFFTSPQYEFTLTGQLGRASVLFVPAAGLVAVLVGSFRAAYKAEQRTRETLAAAEERLRLAQGAARLGTYDHDLGTGAIAWDERLREIWGVSRTAPISWDSIMSSIHPEDRDRLRAVIDRAHAFRGDYLIEYRITNQSDGLERWLRVTGHASFDEGRPVRHVGTVEDVTERKRAAEALEAANVKLADADREKNGFLAVLSHELRNLLTPIRNSLHVLERAIPGGEQAGRARAVIERQMDHICHVVDDLLDVTRVARGKIRLQRTHVDLTDLVRRTAEDHRLAIEADHELSVDLPGQATWVDGDPTRLAQVVGNLLTNAAKFTPRGGRISLSLGHEMDRAVLEVADTGVGMDSDTLQSLFRPFAQSDRSIDRSRGGLGLGLALVRGIVELHGGQVSAQSEGLGRGARFAVSLPLLEEQGAAVPGASTERERSGPARRVLIIEDDRDSADSLFEALSLDGHQVTVAYDGDQGVAKALAEHPEIVLCDLGLPSGMDGYAVARALRRAPGTTSMFLVALTGYAQPEDLDRALEAGFDAHVAKPPELNALERLFARAPVGHPGEEAPPP